jgi:hypothetical protein
MAMESASTAPRSMTTVPPTPKNDLPQTKTALPPTGPPTPKRTNRPPCRHYLPSRPPTERRLRPNSPMPRQEQLQDSLVCS